MTQDVTYGQSNYRAHGGALDVIGSSGIMEIYGDIDVKSAGSIDVESGGAIAVASGGGIDIASGGDIDLASGGHLDVASGGYIDIATGGYLKIPVSNASTAVTADNCGITLLATTAAKTTKVAAPVAGCVKYFYTTAAGTANHKVQRATTTFTFNAADTALTFNAVGETVTLVGVSATKYIIAANVGGVTST